MKFSELKGRAAGDTRWSFSIIMASFFTEGLAVNVEPHVPFVGYLDPDAERIRRIEADEDTPLAIYAMPLDEEPVEEGGVLWVRPNTDAAVERFVEENGVLTMEDFVLGPIPPPDYEEPTPLEFTNYHRYLFHETRMSKTPVAWLFGQEADYFGPMQLELNAGPVQVVDPDPDQLPVYYRQAWVAGLKCPFCSLVDFNLAYVAGLTRPQTEFFLSDTTDRYLALLCPRCNRCVEAITFEDLIGGVKPLAKNAP